VSSEAGRGEDTWEVVPREQSLRSR
jgi:hypothetical protein